VLSGYDLAAPVIGAAQGAVDAYAAHLASSGPPAPGAAACLLLPESAAKADASRAVLYRNISHLLAEGAAGHPVFPARQAR